MFTPRIGRVLCCILGLASPEVPMGAAQTPIHIRDDLGRAISLTRPAGRVISLAPSLTETLFALGAGSQVVGVTDYCNFPPAARMKQSVGGMTTPNLETVIDLHPDLIVVSMEGNLRDDFQRLTQLGVPVFVSNPRDFTGIARSIRQLGVMTGHEGEAAGLAIQIGHRLDSLLATHRGPRPRTLLLVSLQPLIAAGNGTFVSDMLDRAGAENLGRRAAGTYPPFSRESVVAFQPDVILVMSDVLQSTASLPELFPEWKGLPAMIHERVYRVDADLISRPGPRAVDGLEALINILRERHP
jgi:iron complex transport system substrate-binding protein